MQNEPLHEPTLAAGTTALPGLIYGYLLDGKGGGKIVTAQEIANWNPAQGTRWLHFNYRDPQAQEWIYEQSQLHPLVMDALLAEDTRPRATGVGDGLLVILRGVNLTPGAEPDDMVSIRLWLDEHQVVSTRMRSLFSVGDITQMLDQNQGPRNGAEFLVELADRLVWRMSDTVDQFGERLLDLEDQILNGDIEGPRNDLSLLRRQIITLRRYLAPQREAFNKLFLEKHPLLTDTDRLRLRESGDRLLRHIEDLDAVRERAAIAQEELGSRLSEQSNKRMYMLAIMTAIFLPLTFATGLLGINVAGIPGADSPYAFVVFCFLLFVVVSAQLVYLWWRKWL